MSHARRFRNGGFTFVEVMTVIGIMLILLSLLMPVYTKVHEQGNMVSCQNNLRQIGNCLQVYATQQNGYLPSDMPTFNTAWDQGVPCWPLGEFWNGTGAWDYYESQYLFTQCGATTALFLCPSSNMTTAFPEFLGTQHPNANVQYSWLVGNSEWCWIGNNGSFYPNTYQYYGAVCCYDGNGKPCGDHTAATGTFPPAPWGRITTGTTNYYGGQLQFTKSFGYIVNVNLKPDDVLNPPLMSDLCMNIMPSWNWGVGGGSSAYFSHGTQLAGCKCNVLYSDYHVDSDTIKDANSWFISDTQWTSAAQPFFHYR